MDLTEVKQYLRVTNDVDDGLITRIMIVAEGIMRDAVTDYDLKLAGEKFKTKAEMCQLAIIAELYENRNQGSNGIKDYGFTVRTMITQLQYSEVI